jgi:dihydrodipicolinate synthase/N-acetylneuraminate lyase
MTKFLKRGLNVPALSIVDEAGRIIIEEQRQLLRHLVQDGSGTDVIFGVGTTGEWNRLSNAERLRGMEVTIDEVRAINARLGTTVEAWVGVNGNTKQEILANLDAAIQMGADAAVIAPTAIDDLHVDEMVRFFQREVNDLVEAHREEIPVFLYDNADIASPGNVPHVPTQVVKQLSRLPWVRGIKVSASMRDLGNYMKAALHYKLPGEFGVYIGNAMLIFDLYRPKDGMVGRLQEGWHEYLLNYSPPIGVISGPGNVLPREWQKAWRVCWAGDEEMIDRYKSLCGRVDEIVVFEESGRPVSKMLAGLKYALELDGIITSSHVAAGTASLSDEQKAVFRERYAALRESIRASTAERWQTRRGPGA